MVIDFNWNEINYLVGQISRGALTSDALSQRIGRAYKTKQTERYLELKLVQAICKIEKEGVDNEDQL